MRVELWKMFGLGGRLDWYEHNLMQSFTPGTTFQVPRTDRTDATVGFVNVPVTKTVVYEHEFYLLDDLCTVSDSDAERLKLRDKLFALRIEIPDSSLKYDLSTISDSPIHSEDAPGKQAIAARVAEVASGDALEVLSLFCEAYRRAKYQVDSDRGRDLVQSVDLTRRMAAWEFRRGTCFRVSDGSRTISYWLPESKFSVWSGEDNRRLYSDIQTWLRKGTEVAQVSLHDARQALYDGEYSSAVLNSVIAVEAALFPFVISRWKAMGIPKARVDKVKREIGLSQWINVQLTAVTPPNNKPRPDLIGALDRARKLRNDIVHEGRRSVEFGQAQEAVKATERLFAYLATVN